MWSSAAPLMPQPWRMAFADDRLRVAEFIVDTGAQPGLARALARVNAILDATVGVRLPITFAVTDGRPALPVLGDDESYCLEIGPELVVVEAARLCGARHALSTLAQLAANPAGLPIGRIEDRPRYPWRGLMLDVARRHLGMAALHRVVDTMAFYKLNVLHLHLSDDQGFRLRSAAYPKLASSDSYSAAQLRGLVQRAAERGIRVVPELDMPGHVTSWLAAYPEWGPPLPAAVVDEFERQAGKRAAGSRPRPLSGAPGSTASRATKAPRKADAVGYPAVQASKRFGAHKAVLNVADELIYEVIDTLVGELAEIFPDPHIHIGGDEVQPVGWLHSPQVRAYMSRLGLADAVALQAHFNRRLATIAERHGKRLIGWDEVLNGGAPDGMVVQAWRGATARDRAVAAGHACIDSAGYYLDLFYPADVHHAWDPSAATAERLAQEDALLEDPRLAHVAAGLQWSYGWREAAGAVATTQSANRMAKILGGEACLWGELVDERVLPVRLWSRMPVIAERLWSPDIAGSARPSRPLRATGPGALEHEESALAYKTAADISGLEERLQASLDQLAAAGLVDVRQSSRHLLLAFGVAASQIEAVELLEPIKWYGRLLGDAALQARIEGTDMPLARPYDLHRPLDRPVDALLPESFAAKRFARLLAGQPASLADDGERPLLSGSEAAQEEASVLRGDCQRLLGVCLAGPYLPELQAPIDRLGTVLRTVLEVLDGRVTVAAAQAVVAAAGEPAGEYVVAIAPPVLRWLNECGANDEAGRDFA